MSFTSKRLHVQLPCGEITQIEAPAIIPFRIVTCHHPTRPTFGYAFAFPTCHHPTRPTFGYAFAFPTCHHPTRPTFGYAELEEGDPPLQGDPGAIVVAAQDLPLLREQLEAQLKSVIEAERAVCADQEDEPAG